MHGSSKRLGMAGRDHDYTVNMAEQLIERIKALGLPADPAALSFGIRT